MIHFKYSVDAVLRSDVPMNALVLLTTSSLHTYLSLLKSQNEDQWVVDSTVRNGRSCLTPGYSRIQLQHPLRLPFHTDWIHATPVLSMSYIPFLEMDFRFLYRKNYEKELKTTLLSAVQVNSVQEIMEQRAGTVRMMYK